MLVAEQIAQDGVQFPDADRCTGGHGQKGVVGGGVGGSRFEVHELLKHAVKSTEHALTASFVAHLLDLAARVLDVGDGHEQPLGPWDGGHFSGERLCFLLHQLAQRSLGLLRSLGAVVVAQFLWYRLGGGPAQSRDEHETVSREVCAWRAGHKERNRWEKGAHPMPPGVESSFCCCIA